MSDSEPEGSDSPAVELGCKAREGPLGDGKFREIANFFELAVSKGIGLSSGVSTGVTASSAPGECEEDLAEALLTAGVPKNRRGRFFRLNFCTGIAHLDREPKRMKVTNIVISTAWMFVRYSWNLT